MGPALLAIAIVLPGIASAAFPDDLPDQYGNPVNMAAYGGQPLVVIVASGRKLRHIKGW